MNDPQFSPKKKPSKALFAVLVGIVIIVLIVVVAISLKKDDKNNKNASKSNVTTTTNKTGGTSQSSNTSSSSDSHEYSSKATITPFSSGGVTGTDSLPAFPSNSSATDPALQKLVPSITAQDFTGKKVTMSPGTKPIMLVIAAHWCPFCQQELPKIVSLYKDGKLPGTFDLVVVATATRNSGPESGNYPPSAWLTRINWPGQEIADTKDGTIAQAFALDGLPYILYINADGSLQARTQGVQDDSAIIANVKAITGS